MPHSHRISKPQTLVVPFAQKTKVLNELRPALAGVYVAQITNPEGATHSITAATDGYTLAEITDMTDYSQSDDTFPIEPPTPCVVPADAIKEMGTSDIPVVLSQFSDTSTNTDIITTELTNKNTTTTLTTKPIPEKYPDYNRILPADYDVTPPHLSITVNADYLLKVAKLFADFHKQIDKDGLHQVTIELSDNPNSPIVFKARTGSHKARALLMPIRK